MELHSTTVLLQITTILKAVQKSLVIMYNKHLARAAVRMSSDDDAVGHLLWPNLQAAKLTKQDWV